MRHFHFTEAPSRGEGSSQPFCLFVTQRRYLPLRVPTLRVAPLLRNNGDGLSLQPSVENGARSSKGQTDGGSGRRSRLKRTPQRVGRGGGQLREIVNRERHKRVMAATQQCHRLPQEILAATMPVTHALPLVMQHGSRRISSKEDTGTNPFMILHITRRTKPIIQLCRFVSVFQ